MLKNPYSTIFVVAFKDKKVDARTKLAKSVKKERRDRETKKIPDYQLTDWVRDMIQGQRLEIKSAGLAFVDRPYRKRS